MGPEIPQMISISLARINIFIDYFYYTGNLGIILRPMKEEARAPLILY
jgi:hypothetical protein